MSLRSLNKKPSIRTLPHRTSNADDMLATRLRIPTATLEGRRIAETIAVRGPLAARVLDLLGKADRDQRTLRELRLETICLS
jgi:hypothetical protein